MHIRLALYRASEALLFQAYEKNKNDVCTLWRQHTDSTTET
ncbi:hypothetical protein [Hoylesella oralis]|nr:hypothetical protein [Hoylesella oralis]